MKKQKFTSNRILAFIIIAIVLGGCFGGKYKTTAFKEVDSMDPGKGLVYIYRPGKFLGSGNHYTVNDGDKKVSEIHLYNKGYLEYQADTGKHLFWTQLYEDKYELIVNIKAGQVYYIEAGLWELELVPPEIGREKIKKCKLIADK